MLEQPIIQAAVSSVETFNGTKSKFKSKIVSVENAAQISGQNILYITFSKMVGSLLTTAYRFKGPLVTHTWNDLKMNFQGSIQQYLSTVMPPKLLPICNKVLMSYLKCTYIVLVNVCSKIHHMTDMSQILAEGLNHYTMVWELNSNTLKEKVVDTEVPT